jgi:hypothetical protein
MMDRGDCTFVQKVRNAQHAGAAGVIIADNVCLCGQEDCVMVPDQPCEGHEPIMADDGSGSDISIPSFLLFKQDADRVKDVVLQNNIVQMEMAWNMGSPDDRVEYDVWTSPSDELTHDFFQSFQTVARALGKRAYFTPHMSISDGTLYHCQGTTSGQSACSNLCTNNGRYCANDPDGDQEYGISGADVVVESLRRVCIWNKYGVSDGVGEEWWDYVAEFDKRCSSVDYFTDAACIKDAYKHSNVEADIIERCMEDSGGVEGDQVNTKLNLEVVTQKKRGVVVKPSAYVNMAPLHGALTATNVFREICSGFATYTAPSICEQCSSCSDVVGCIGHKGQCPSDTGASADGISTNVLAASMLLMFVILVLMGTYHHRKRDAEIREQVRGILAEYMPLEDQETDTALKTSEFSIS